MCFRALLYAVFHRIRIGFEGSKLKIVDQKASDGRVSQSGFRFLRWLQVVLGVGPWRRCNRPWRPTVGWEENSRNAYSDALLLCAELRQAGDVPVGQRRGHAVDGAQHAREDLCSGVSGVAQHCVFSTRRGLCRQWSLRMLGRVCSTILAEIESHFG